MSVNYMKINLDLWGLGMSQAHVMGRAWLYEDAPNEIEVWEYALEPMTLKGRSGAEWCRCHLLELYDDDDLRELLGVPMEGIFQVIFKGIMKGWWEETWECGPEYDECFELEESKFEPIPLEFLNLMTGDNVKI